MKKRAGENKAVEFSLRILFYRMEDLGIRRTDQINIIYELFKLFNYDDYGKEKHTIALDIGEREQKERIRKQFQATILKEYKQQRALLRYFENNREKIFNTPKAKEARDLIMGRMSSD